MKDTIEIGRRYGDLIAVARTGSGSWHPTCANNHELRYTLTKRLRAGVCSKCKTSDQYRVGSRYGKLTIVENLNQLSRCVCECGKEVTVRNHNLLAGHTKSCGCGRVGPRPRVERDEHATLYRVWTNVRQRTGNPCNPNWDRYGGRGIANHLGDYSTFRTWAFAHGYKQGLTLDRRNNNGDYRYDNLRWVPRSVQARNTRRNVLNPNLVRKIRRLHRAGHGPKAIQRMIGVAALGTIKNVLYGRNWLGIA